MGNPWLTLIGLGENGLGGLSAASHGALDRAEVIFGGPRHLALVAAGERGQPWPVPFDLGPVLAMRGRAVVALASGDPFWFGAGGSLMAHLVPEEWVSHPAPSIFQLVANRLGWRLEECLCLGLHAAPFARLRPVLGRGVRAICTLRDGEAVGELAEWLAANGHPGARLIVLERLGGPLERSTLGTPPSDIGAPVSVAIEATDPGLPQASGLPDALFENDGQITKRPIRALTLSALAPRAGEVLWDIGAGSGSIGIEWLLAGAARVLALEADPMRAARARGNAAAFGLAHRHQVVEAQVPEGLEGLPVPDAVFVGGGTSEALLTRLWEVMPAGCRLVLNAVTIETEALVLDWSARQGGKPSEDRPVHARCDRPQARLARGFASRAVERGAMIVAGFGFRSETSVAALQDALLRAGGAERVTHLATLSAKVQGLAGLAAALGLPVVAVAPEALVGQAVVTWSERVAALHGTGSVAEAVALAAAGPGARLRGPRAVSADGTATAAIAEGAG